jgi:4-diphosphocytidyl-2-C-methyl-D-erythritol kinase
VKKIPVGAGLGGGSADAAAVLRAMNLLAPEPLSQRKLEALALSLGADIPFLISNSTTALARGYGEVLTPIPALPPRFVALAIPDFAVATRDAYAWLDESNREPSINQELEDFSWAALDQRVHNDFEAIVAEHHPEIPVLRQAMLDAGAPAAAMTGSGSVVYGLFDSESSMSDISLPRGASLVRTRTAARVVQPIRIG